MPNASAALLGLIALASGNIRPGTAFLLPTSSSQPASTTTTTTRLAAHSHLQAALHLMQQQKAGPSGTGGRGRTGGGAFFVSVCSCIYPIPSL